MPALPHAARSATPSLTAMDHLSASLGDGRLVPRTVPPGGAHCLMTMPGPPAPPPGYADWLADLKDRIRQTRLRVALAVNSELILLYWRVGRDILERQARGWLGREGGGSARPRSAGGVSGLPRFPRANLLYMRAFAEAWPDLQIVQQVVGQLPWDQNIELLGLKDLAARLWYAETALAHGWGPSSAGCADRHRLARAPGQGDHKFRTGPAARNLRSAHHP